MKLVKTASRWQQFVIESLSHSNDSFKTAEYCRSESNDCFYEWFSESVIHPSQRFGFRFEHKRKHHIVTHRLDNQWEIAVICFAPATIVLMREFRTRKRDERVKRASAYGTERLLSVIILLLREREQPQILAAADRSDITI